MTDPATSETRAPASPAEILTSMSEEAAGLKRELDEIDLLIAQARAEVIRHEARRVAATDKLAAAVAAASARGRGGRGRPRSSTRSWS